MSTESHHLYFTTERAWEAMLEDIAHARKTILLEQYIFDSLGDGQIGTAFVDALLDCARRGLDVRVLVDSFGSTELLMSSALGHLYEAGVQVAWNTLGNPFYRFSVSLHLFRNHRKLLVVDGDIAYVGGVIMSERARSWRDTHLRVTGEPAQGLAQAFKGHWDAFVRNKHDMSTVYPVNDHYKVVASAPGVRRRGVRRDLLRAIDGAKSHVQLTTPYLAPDRALRHALYRAAARSVTVELILPAESDGTLPQWGSRANFAALLKHGVRLYQYKPAMLHAKTVVIDDTWATVGSTNLDPLSLHLNHELNLHTTDSHIISELTEQFQKDKAVSDRVTNASWRNRSLKKRILYDGIGTVLSWVI